ncbi:MULTISPECIES: hypothetical protein [unclassified Corynebacterium]|uniref:hypothetical protein n=1 Tax=unclassified Corynebacterium TaxID=2624378 RepID=UPI00265107A3|nr:MULTISPECIES: hypothetical protein [unclassified Corynebacterium]MDN8593784.1 hypothetical protein [Corynebacterium sp. P4_F2]WKK55895.1 hypothetical protein QYR03_01275 [Corynebacterium sp. P4-C1]WKK63304.1 hypothetical protein QYR04_10975 [Corynebacterium sp. P8-C1]
MAGSRRNREAAIWLTLALVVAILLGTRMGYIGLLIGIAIAAVAFIGYRNSTVDPEVEALKSSLRVARDDIAQVVAEYEDFMSGIGPDALAERTLTYRALAHPHSDIPAIEDFHLRLGSSRRFLARVDTHLGNDDLDRRALERMINIADQRACDLAASWADARRAARRLGPG